MNKTTPFIFGINSCWRKSFKLISNNFWFPKEIVNTLSIVNLICDFIVLFLPAAQYLNFLIEKKILLLIFFS